MIALEPAWLTWPQGLVIPSIMANLSVSGRISPISQSMTVVASCLINSLMAVTGIMHGVDFCAEDVCQNKHQEELGS
jgi:hypothetical protein